MGEAMIIKTITTMVILTRRHVMLQTEKEISRQKRRNEFLWPGSSTYQFRWLATQKERRRES
jgi:hypothetical protein